MKVGLSLAALGLFALTALAGSPALAHQASSPVPTGRIAVDPIAHDPTVIKQGAYYYSFITGDIATHTYLPVRRSKDMLHWTSLATVFATAPAWVVQELGITPGDFWAPDITYFDGVYHLYYAASSFGTNNSVIGLATTRTLDPDSPAFGWVDHGMVMRSSPTDNFNAIDPDVILDPDGQVWLSFGSFWDGVKMRRLDRRTGMPVDTTLYSLASRGGASIEGASIVRHGGFYYLFASLDYCCRGVDSDYRTVVGRASTVTGPYVDRDGVPMLAGGGTDLLRGYNEFRGTGGGDVFTDQHGDWFAHHYYDAADAGLPKLSIRRVWWNGGWPSLGDPVSGSSRVGHGNAWFSVVNRASGGAVSNPTCGYEGADIRIAAVDSSACQQWRLEDHPNGYVSILNRYSNKAAEIAACVNTDGARVAQWGWLNNDCQRFRVLPTDTGWSRLENPLAGRVLEAAGCGGPGTAVQAYTWLNNVCQQFRLDPVGDLLIADSTGTRTLGVSHGTVTASGSAQRWRFVHTAEGYFQIVSESGRALAATTGRDGSVRLVLSRADQVTDASQWRLDAVGDGSYNLVSLDGHAASLPGLAPHILLWTP